VTLENSESRIFDSRTVKDRSVAVWVYLLSLIVLSGIVGLALEKTAMRLTIITVFYVLCCAALLVFFFFVLRLFLNYVPPRLRMR